jgi:hypothetical protein
MNERATVRAFPIFQAQDEQGKQERRPAWFWRYLNALGFYEMAGTTKVAHGNAQINFQKLSFFMGVVLTILGGFWWSFQQGDASGRKSERQQVINEQLQEHQKAQDTKIDYLERMQSAILNGQPTPTPMPKEQK